MPRPLPFLLPSQVRWHQWRCKRCGHRFRKAVVVGTTPRPCECPNCEYEDVRPVRPANPIAPKPGRKRP